MDTTTRSSHWSLTINNPTADDEENIAVARQKGWKVDGQKEGGKEGTPHYQLYLQTPQLRFSAVKKAFPRAHIEVARNPKALAQYVHKEDTRVGALVVKQEMYPSQKRFFELVWDVVLEDDTGASEYARGCNNRFKQPVNALNHAAAALIRRGYVVETLASNPMTIATWKQFHDALLARKILGETTRQTDTRPDPAENSLAVEHNPDADPSQSHA